MAAQDYFVVIVKNEKTTYNYPKDVAFTIIDGEGNETKFEIDEAFTFQGDYTLSIQVPWSAEPELITSEGGKLELFVLPEERRNWTQKDEDKSKTVWYDQRSNKLGLERKEISVSQKDAEHFNLLVVFNNGVVFKYEDGTVRAWLNNKEVNVTNHYLVDTPEGLLKISFDPKDGEFWYVFDS